MRIHGHMRFSTLHKLSVLPEDGPGSTSMKNECHTFRNDVRLTFKNPMTEYNIYLKKDETAIEGSESKSWNINCLRLDHIYYSCNIIFGNNETFILKSVKKNENINTRIACTTKFHFIESKNYLSIAQTLNAIMEING